VTPGLQVLYEFNETSGTTVGDTSGVAPALDLTIATPANTAWGTGTLDITGPTLINTGTPASKITNAVVASNEITVEAWIQPDNTVQNGPARIVTISDSPFARNMTLGQGVWSTTGDRIEARLRTTGTGANGTPATQTAAGTLDTSVQHVVYTRNAAGVTTVYIDGVTVSTGTATGDMTGWDTTMELALAAELDGTRTWAGEYSLVAIYNQALTAAEVTQNFGAGPNPTTGDGSGGGGGSGGPAIAYTSYYSFAGTTIGYANPTGFTAIAAGHLGSTEATINTTGTAVRQTYTPFGATRSSTSNLLDTDRTYTGQTDDQTGLLHYRARQYDPQLGRFVQADAIIPGAGDLQNFNKYSYVRSNPVRYTDPTGRFVHKKIGDVLDSVGTVVIDAAEVVVDGAVDFGVGTVEGVAGAAVDARGAFLHPSRVYGPILDDPLGAAAGTAQFAGTMLIRSTPRVGQALFLRDVANDPRLAGREFGATAFDATLILTGIGTTKAVASRLTKAKPPTLAEVPDVVYRGGSPSPSNLTPRPSDAGILSFRDSLSNPWPLAPGQRPVFQPGKPYFGVDTDLLPTGSVIPDGVPPGHVSVLRIDPGLLRDAVTDGSRGKFPK